MPRDVVVDIRDDHRRLTVLLEELTSALDPAARRRVLTELAEAMARHTRAEEVVIYPVVRAELAGGEEAVNGSAYEHIRVAGSLATLATMPLHDPDLQAACRNLALELRFHIAQEESGWLATMERHLDPKRRHELSCWFAEVGDRSEYITLPHERDRSGLSVLLERRAYPS